MLKNILTVVSLALVLSPGCVSAADKPTTEATKVTTKTATNSGTDAASETSLMKKIAGDGLLEVDLGKLGEKRAINSEVKKFAEQMVVDHSKANNELQQIAKNRNIELPKTLTEQQKQKEKFLETTQKKAFDGAYMKDMVEGHKKAIEAVTQATKIGTTDFKSWAVKTLPVIQHHSHEAKAIDAKLPKYK